MKPISVENMRHTLWALAFSMMILTSCQIREELYVSIDEKSIVLNRTELPIKKSLDSTFYYAQWKKPRGLKVKKNRITVNDQLCTWKNKLCLEKRRLYEHYFFPVKSKALRSEYLSNHIERLTYSYGPTYERANFFLFNKEILTLEDLKKILGPDFTHDYRETYDNRTIDEYTWHLETFDVSTSTANGILRFVTISFRVP